MFFSTYFLFLSVIIHLVFSSSQFLPFSLASTYTTHPATGTYYQSPPQTLPLSASYSSTSNHLSLSGGLKSLPKTGSAAATIEASSKAQNNSVQNLNISKNGINNNMINININNNINNNMNNNSIVLNTTSGLQSRILSTATATLRPLSPGSPAVPYASADTYAANDMNAEPGMIIASLTRFCSSGGMCVLEVFSPLVCIFFSFFR